MAGVGTVIKELLFSLGIRSNEGCSCTALAQEMDRVGPEHIEKNLDLYVDKMLGSIKKWRRENHSILPTPPRIVVEKLILYGISRSRN